MNTHEFWIEGSQPKSFYVTVDDLQGQSWVFLKKCEDPDDCEFSQ